jgi:hypothetical protein
VSKKLTTEEFINKSIEVHGGKYDYDGVIYDHSKKKVKITCESHGIFEQIPNSHLMGIGCPWCAGKKQSQSNFILTSKKIHKNKYNYSLVKYKSARSKVKIICKEHGIFAMRPNNHLNGSGCPTCGIEKVANLHRKSQTKFIEESKQIHGSTYDYSLVDYKNIHTKVKIKCKKHGIFLQSPHLHIHRDRSGCPICKSSRGETRIRVYLENNNITYESQKTFNDCRNQKTNSLLKFDFYLPLENILIEYDGLQHFMCGRKLGNYVTTAQDLKNTQSRDKIKTKYARWNKIQLLRITYKEFSIVEKILDKVLT